MTDNDMSSGAFRPAVRRALPGLILLRLLYNTGIRMAYTYLPAFARGAQISDTAMGNVVAFRDVTALSGPLIGKLTDRSGTGLVMAVAGLGASISLLAGAVSPTLLIVGLVGVGFFGLSHTVATQAWIGHAVAYERRSRATGLIELSWGGAALFGLPIVGLLIDRFGWRAAPLALGLVSLPLSLMSIRQATMMSEGEPAESPKPTMNRTAYGALAGFGLLTGSAQFMFLGHGLWLEDTYELSAGQIGLALVGSAVMEVMATLSTATVTDKIGKRMAIIGGASIMTLGMTGIALFSTAPLVIGLVLLAVVFLGFEFAIVSAIPLMSELDPAARAAMVGRSMAISTVFRAGISVTAVWIYEARGFGFVMGLAAILGVLCVLVNAMFVDEPEPPAQLQALT